MSGQSGPFKRSTPESYLRRQLNIKTDPHLQFTADEEKMEARKIGRNNGLDLENRRRFDFNEFRARRGSKF